MKNIKIELEHDSVKAPKYAIEEVVAIKSDCDPKLWLTGKVTGLQRDRNNTWNYTILLEYPQGYCEEYKKDELLTINERKKEQLIFGLKQFTGSTALYKHWLGFHYTQGVKYLADEAKSYWLIDAICSHQTTSFLNKYPALQEFQIWRLEVENNSAVLICEVDTDQQVLTQKIPYTDFPLPEVKLYLIEKVIILPQEY